MKNHPYRRPSLRGLKLGPSEHKAGLQCPAASRLHDQVRVGLRGKPAGQVPGALKYHGINRKYVEMLNTCLKTVGLKGRQIISLPGAPTYLGPVLIRV
jgi:hypothetical protein